jgi:hypothetical protein
MSSAPSDYAGIVAPATPGQLSCPAPVSLGIVCPERQALAPGQNNPAAPVSLGIVLPERHANLAPGRPASRVPVSLGIARPERQADLAPGRPVSPGPVSLGIVRPERQALAPDAPSRISAPAPGSSAQTKKKNPAYRCSARIAAMASAKQSINKHDAHSDIGTSDSEVSSSDLTSLGEEPPKSKNTTSSSGPKKQRKQPV